MTRRPWHRSTLRHRSWLRCVEGFTVVVNLLLGTVLGSVLGTLYSEMTL